MATAVLIPPAEPAVTLAPPAPPVFRTVTLGRGDSLEHALRRARVDKHEARAAIAALARHVNLRKLRPGQEVRLNFSADDAALTALTLPAGAERSFTARRGGGGWTGEEITHPLTTSHVRLLGGITSSLYLAAQKAGAPPEIIVALIHMYSHAVDFQRDMRAGDTFEVLFAQEHNASGVAVRTGDIVFAALTVRGKRHALWRHDIGGKAQYFDADGRGARRFLMRTPIDGARLSSGYGMRRHPILGYSRLHAGLDFAAPSGTPIYAAGNGVIEELGRKGGYGKYIRIRHANSYKTAYAHMRSYARGMRKGRRVEQGQVIGYVGSTGRSTGPHLHYEVHKNGRQINPRHIPGAPQKVLAGAELDGFRKTQQQTAALMIALADGPPAPPAPEDTTRVVQAAH